MQESVSEKSSGIIGPGYLKGALNIGQRPLTKRHNPGVAQTVPIRILGTSYNFGLTAR